MDWKRYAFLLGAMASALHATPQLQLATTALGPINIAKNANGPTQTVVATNIGTGSLNLAATGSASWLQPSVVNGTTIQIVLNTAPLAPGSYTEFVTVTASGAIDAPQNISVTIQVDGVPSSLTFFAATGQAGVTQQVITQGRATATPTTTSGSGWLAVSLSNAGSFTSFFPYNVTVTPQSGQTAGTYVGTIAFSGSPVASDNISVPVTLNLTSSPIQQFSPAALQLVSGGTIATSSAVTVSNAGIGTLAITGAQGSASWLTATVSGTTVTVTANPSGLAAGTYQGTVSVASNAANTVATTLPVEFTVEPSAAPLVSFRGVVDNATFAGTLSPGMISQVYGVLMAGATPTVASSLPLSTTLGGVQVTVNGIPAPVYYASSGVIDFVVPFGTQPGPATVSVIYNGVSSNTVSTTVVARAPRILYFQLTNSSSQTFNYGIMINASDYSYPVPTTPGLFSHPAHRGDTITVYALGFGLTDQNVADGAASPTSPLANTPAPAVYLGGGFSGSATDSAVLFSGLAPGYVGLYQLNFTIPADAPLGNAIAFEVQVAGATSNPVYLAISQ